MEFKKVSKIKMGIIAVICMLVVALGTADFSSVNAAPFATPSNQWAPVASMNGPRYLQHSYVINGKIYVMGGHNGAVALASVEAYNPATNTWATMASMKEPRYYYSSVELDGKVYVIGGHNGSKILSSVEVYDPATNTWTSLPNMKEARHYTSAVVCNGKIYVIGGHSGSAILSSIEVYDPATNTWTTPAVMKTARHGHTSVLLNGKIYAIGGHDGTNYLSSVEVYDPVTGIVSLLPSMNANRQLHKSVVLDGKIYSIGGYNGNYLASAEVYDPEKNTWTLLPNMSNAKDWFELFIYNGKIYVSGGEYVSGTYLSSVGAYNPITNTWSSLPNMLTARAYHTSVVVNDRIYAIGGANRSMLSAVEAYQIYDIQINKATSALRVGETDILQVTKIPAEIQVNWTSSDPAVATVDDNGKVTAIKAGTASITAKATDGSNYSVTCVVTVTGEPKMDTILKLNKTATSITIGQVETLLAITNSPAVTWSSANTNVATVDSNGNVIGIQKGTATITATTADGKIATCVVTVNAKSRAKLIITMTNNSIKTYDLSMEALNTFLNWYDARANGVGKAYYIFVNPNTVYKEYIPYDKIEYFYIEEYEEN